MTTPDASDMFLRTKCLFHGVWAGMLSLLFGCISLHAQERDGSIGGKIQDTPDPKQPSGCTIACGGGRGASYDCKHGPFGFFPAERLLGQYNLLPNNIYFSRSRSEFSGDAVTGL